jgi:hypothetical protein
VASEGAAGRVRAGGPEVARQADSAGSTTAGASWSGERGRGGAAQAREFILERGVRTGVDAGSRVCEFLSCILPAMLVVILGPAAIQIAKALVSGD